MARPAGGSGLRATILYHGYRSDDLGDVLKPRGGRVISEPAATVVAHSLEEKFGSRRL